MTKVSLIKKRSYTIGALLALALALIAVGCGGDDDNGAGGGDDAQGSGQVANGTSPPGDGGSDGNSNGDADRGGAEGNSKAQFIKEADEACKAVGDEMQQTIDSTLSQPVGEGGEEEDVYRELILTVMVPGVEEKVEAIEALDVPPEAEKAADTLVANYEQVVAKMKAKPSEFFFGEVPVVTKSEDQAEKLGFDRCGPLA